MKRRLRYIILAGVALILTVATLCGAASAAQPTSVGNQLNYGITGMGSNETFAASALFEKLFGEAPTTSEAAYLDDLSGISFIYNGAVPDSIVSTNYNGEEGTLELSLNAYTFTAANGAEVCWIPRLATLEEQTATFVIDENGTYSACLKNLFHSDDFDVKIDFDWTVEIPAEAVDALLTSTYTAAQDALAVLKAYEAEYNVWYAANEKYLTYQAYLQSIEDYARYLEEMEAYENAKQLYDAYMVKYEAYIAEKQLYDDWKHYYAYQEYLQTGVEQRAAYLAYKAQVDKITAKLAVLENLFVTDSNGWQLYASLMGNTVTEVISQKDTLMAAGVLPEVIDAAGDSTEVLRVLMQGYSDLRDVEYASEHERMTVLYAYYTEHYTEIRDNFSKLYGALHTLHDNSLVVAELSRRGKLAHYRQFVGELYVTRTCLDDSFARTQDWVIGKKRLTDVVEAINILPDTNTADPTGVSMPAEDVPVVEEVTPIEKPMAPQPQKEPVAPTPVVAEPTKPQTVAKPDTQNPPPAAESVGEPPAAPEMDAALRAAAEDLRAGKLPKRKALGASRSITLQKSMSCPVSISNRMTVTFYAYDGVTVLDRQTLEYGSLVIYHGADPAREPDNHYVYEFQAWVLPDGTAAEMVATKNLSLYAYYHTTVRYYTVTWILDNETKVELLPYGEIPISPFVTAREPDEFYTYAFSGWDKEILPVTEDVTYTASIEKIPNLYTVTWVIGDVVVTQEVPYGTYPTYTGSTERAPDAYRYEFLGWNKALTPVQGNVTYTAAYQKKPLAFADDGSVMEAIHTEDAVIVKSTVHMIDVREAALLARSSGKRLEIQWAQFALVLEGEALAQLTDSFCRKVGITEISPDEMGTVYGIAYFNSSGILLELELSAGIRALSNANGDLMSCYLFDGENWKRYGSDTAPITGRATFRICDVFPISVVAAENCNISQLLPYAEAGLKVDLRLGCTFGYEVSAARVTAADGTEISVDEDMSFLMPAGEVSVELTVTKIVYHVTFIADGKVISEADYFLGEEIVPPTDPTKASDDTYVYTFSGWSRDVTIAVGDDHAPVYEAIFTATPLNANDPFLSGGNNNFMVTVVLPVLLLLIALAVVGRILWKRRKQPGTTNEKKQAKSVSAKAGRLAKLRAVYAERHRVKNQPSVTEPESTAAQLAETEEITETAEISKVGSEAESVSDNGIDTAPDQTETSEKELEEIEK